MFGKGFSEKNRQEMVWVFLIPAVISLMVVSAQANAQNDLHGTSFVIGAAIGCVMYAVFFTKEKWRRYFPEAMFAFAAGFAGLGPLYAMGTGAIEKPFPNPDVVAVVIVITLCVLYRLSVWRLGVPTPPEAEATSEA